MMHGAPICHDTNSNEVICDETFLCYNSCWLLKSVSMVGFDVHFRIFCFTYYAMSEFHLEIISIANLIMTNRTHVRKIYV